MPFLALLKIREAFRISLHFPLKINTLQSIRMSGVGSLTRLESDMALERVSMTHIDSSNWFHAGTFSPSVRVSIKVECWFPSIDSAALFQSSDGRQSCNVAMGKKIEAVNKVALNQLNAGRWRWAGNSSGIWFRTSLQTLEKSLSRIALSKRSPTLRPKGNLGHGA